MSTNSVMKIRDHGVAVLWHQGASDPIRKLLQTLERSLVVFPFGPRAVVNMSDKPPYIHPRTIMVLGIGADACKQIAESIHGIEPVEIACVMNFGAYRITCGPDQLNVICWNPLSESIVKDFCNSVTASLLACEAQRQGKIKTPAQAVAFLERYIDA